jgi:3-isopropylmalate dehydratase small subunit
VPSLDLHAIFPLDAHARTQLVGGLDAIAATLAHEDAIERYESRRAEWMPSMTYRRAT